VRSFLVPTGGLPVPARFGGSPSLFSRLLSFPNPSTKKRQAAISTFAAAFDHEARRVARRVTPGDYSPICLHRYARGGGKKHALTLCHFCGHTTEASPCNAMLVRPASGRVFLPKNAAPTESPVARE